MPFRSGVGIFFVSGDVYIKELVNKCLIFHNKNTILFVSVRIVALIAAVG